MKIRMKQQAVDSMRRLWVHMLLVVVAWSAVLPGLAAVNTWQGTGTGNWHADPVNNWSEGRVPEAGDEVVIAYAGVVIDQAVPASGSFASLTVGSQGTLIFTNWNTAVNATEISVKSTGMITCAGPFTNAPAMSNRVWLVCQNLTVDLNGQINVNAKGYAGAVSNQFISASGPGGGMPGGDGGAYGGFGGKGGAGGVPVAYSRGAYGDPRAPFAPGSGGSCAYPMVAGGAGGGAIRIDASGNVRVNGTISANGGDRIQYPPHTSQAGGGSGGGIYITCQTIDGGGTVRANGGAGQAYGGWGSGGRIALAYDPVAQRNVTQPNLKLSAQPKGPASGNPTVFSTLLGDIGTVYMPDTALLRESMNVSGQIVTDVAAWEPDTLMIDNAWVRFPQDGFQLTVTNDVTIRKGAQFGRLDVGGSAVTNFWQPTALYIGVHFRHYAAPTPPTLKVGGNLILTNGAELVVFSAATNGVEDVYGSLVEVAGDMRLATGCFVYPASHWYNGGSPLFRVQNLSVAAGAGFNANWLGYGSSPYPTSRGYGPGGGGKAYVGGSYGGLALNEPSDKVYGSANAPTLPGSGAAADTNLQGPFGGGLVRIEATKTVTLFGSITANGQHAIGGHVGGGSGGGIYLQCRTFVSDVNTVLQANGGLKSGSLGTGGGGGRIAVWRTQDSPPAVVVPTALGADGSGDGSVVMAFFPPAQTLLILR